MLVAAIVPVAGIACSNAPRPAPHKASGSPVEVVNISFSPASLEVERGTEVVWTNRDDGVHHTVTSGIPGDDGVPGVKKAKRARPDGVFDADLADVSSEFRFTFTEPGTFAYFCRVHPSMTGQVIVR